MVNRSLDRTAAMCMLDNLATTQQAETIVGVDPDNTTELGAVVCFLRYGIYEAGKILVKAGVPAQVALDWLAIARANGLAEQTNLDFSR